MIELSHKEAVSICKEILHLRVVEKFPIRLMPLGSQDAQKKNQGVPAESDEESDWESEIEDNVEDERDVIETDEVEEGSQGGC